MDGETWIRLRAEPYRLFFPLGLACAAVGLGVWIPFYFLPQSFPYPGQAHALIQIQGFLLCFIFGFLCTMLPKVLGVAPLGTWQFAFFPIAIAGMVVAALAGAPRIGQALHLLILLNFFAFILRRWPARRGNPPPTFVFIALAMASDLTGTAFRLLALSGIGGGSMLRAGALLQFQAFPCLLILGVGGFLLPKLLGNEIVDPETLRSGVPKQMPALLPLGLAFFLSYGIEAWLPPTGMRWAAAARAAIWAWFLFGRVRAHRVPFKLHPYLTGGRLSLFAVWLGLAMPGFLPAYALAWEHIVFITGFLWLTVSIAARVVAAHGGRLEFLGRHGKLTWGYGWLLVLAAASRVSTDIWTGGHWLHMAVAAGFALAALAIWAFIYAPLFRTFPGRG